MIEMLEQDPPSSTSNLLTSIFYNNETQNAPLQKTVFAMIEARVTTC